jgi:hypothetical protein
MPAELSQRGWVIVGVIVKEKIANGAKRAV